MKVTEIELGKEYAVRQVMPAAAGVSKCSPIVMATAIDTAGNTVVLQHPAMVLSAAGKAALRSNPDRLPGNRHFERGKKTIRVKATDVICFSDEWQYDQPDGRAEAPRIRYESGHRIVEPRIPVLA